MGPYKEMPPTTRSATAGAEITESGLTTRSVEGTLRRSTSTAGPSIPRKIKRKRDEVPPTYTIDLSLPPAERYIQVAMDFKTEILGLTSLFDEVADSLEIPLPLSTIKSVAKLFLRRVYSDEQTEELRGVSEAVGVEMYLLVAFNVLLDLFMGCTSGGVKVSDEDELGARMCHFRTLDWGMDKLRSVVVKWEFVEKPKGAIIARAIGYVGFVGVLTGVRWVLFSFPFYSSFLKVSRRFPISISKLFITSTWSLSLTLSQKRSQHLSQLPWNSQQ
jgi:hypothetical protein